MAKKSGRLVLVAYLLCALAVVGVLFASGVNFARAEETAVTTSETVTASVESSSVSDIPTVITVVEPTPTPTVEETPVVVSGEVDPAPLEVTPVVPEVEVVTPVVVETAAAEVVSAPAPELAPETRVVLETLSTTLDQLVAALVVSDEVSATTLEATLPPTGSIAISDEVSIKTSTTGSNSNPEVVSDEVSIKTLPTGTTTEVVSDEVSATTTGGSDGGCTGNCGGPTGGGCVSNCGGGGGSYGGGITLVPPPSCPLYLTKYIRLGYSNDETEVRKLQKFLRDFEGFSQVPVTGFYDQITFEAVQAFQVRYGQDVLNPWGLATNDPTGFVFITTSYAINQIYCQRSTDNNFDLAHIYDDSRLSGGSASIGSDQVGVLPAEATTTATSTLSGGIKGFFQAAGIGLLNFITNHPAIWLTLLLLLALLVLLYLIWKLRNEDDVPVTDDEVTLPTTTAPEDLHPLVLPLDGDDKVTSGEEIVVDEVEQVPPNLPIEDLSAEKSSRSENE